MTYVTKGEYQSTDEGYLIGYKLVSASYRSFHNRSFTYTQGKVAGHRPDEVRRRGLFGGSSHYSGDQLHHCCTQKELERNYTNYIDPHDGARLVRLLIHPNDLIRRGVCYRAYVDLISPVMRQWGVFEPDGPLAPDLPPVTELEKKKLNAGLPVDQVISVIMEAKPEPAIGTRIGVTLKAPRYNLGDFPSDPYILP